MVLIKSFTVTLTEASGFMSLKDALSQFLFSNFLAVISQLPDDSDDLLRHVTMK